MFLVRIISALPFWLIYSISRVASFALYHILRYRRTIVRANLKNSFPEESQAEIEKIEKQFYQKFPKIFLENIKAYSFKNEDWEKRVEIKNPQLPLSILDAGTPVILMAGHTANWEWPAFAIGRLLGYPMEFLYKPVRNQFFDHMWLNLRERHGGTAIPKEQAIRRILKRKTEPRFIGMIADQLPSIGTEKYWTQFLNQETPFYIGGERIATLVGYAVLYMECRVVSKGKYQIRFEEIAMPPYEKGEKGIIESFVRKLETTIEENPSDYLWSHRRWKYTKEEATKFLSELATHP